MGYSVGRRACWWRASTAAWVLLSLGGCWWQRDAYTEQMGRGGGGPNASALLGEPLTGGPVSLRPPKPAEPAQAPQGFAAAAEGGDPAAHVLLFIQSGQQPMGQFVSIATDALKKTNVPTPGQPQKMDDQTYGNRTFNLYSIQGDLNGVIYDWYLYFVREGEQNVMVAFVFPHDQFEQFGKAMVSSLETLQVAAAGGEQ